jgi:hypothetical protein
VRGVVALIAALALALAGCGGDDGGGSEEDATALLKRGFATDVDTGLVTFDTELEVRGVPGVGGPLRLELEGPFRAAPSPTQMPELDMEFRASGQGQSYDGRVVITRENAWVEYSGTAYEVGEELWARLLQALEQAGENQPNTFADAGIDPLEWVQDAETDGEEDVGGTATTKVTGKLDMEGMLRDVNRITRGQRLPESTLRDVEEVVDDVEFEAWIGEDDIWRRITAETEFDIPEGERDSFGGMEGGRVSLDVRLDEPNQPVEIEGLTGAQPIDGLLQQLGIPPELLLGPGFAQPTPG